MRKGAKGRCEFCPEHPEKILNQFHMEHYHFMGRYPCKICRYNAQFPREIAEHVKEDHPGTDCARCKGCKEMISFGEDPGAFQDHSE